MSEHDKAVKAAAEAREDLMANLRRVMADAEDLLAATVDVSSTGVDELRERARKNLSQAREQMLDIEDEVRARARRAASMTDDYVHENPWASVGMAAAAGMLLGLLLGRR